MTASSPTPNGPPPNSGATTLCRTCPSSTPPVWTEFPPVPWPEKEDAFVMIGRIAPEKRVEQAIRVLGALRSRGHKLALHLCGAIPPDAYGQMVAALCAANRDWVFPHGQVAGSQKAALLARCRYGIQMRAREPFGISVAEMVKAGAVVFAPNGGGQAEILNHPDLLFASEAEAIEKIEAVIGNPERQAGLRAHLASRAGLFSAGTFVREARAYIADALSADRQGECASNAQRL